MHPFTSSLLLWHKENARDLPWKEDKDPYRIWISEIILQQTRVAQGTPYYLRFVKRFPDIKSLARATEDEVMKFWEGLGYYSRARNLHYSAKLIVEKYHGKFPPTYKEILALKGIGPYTAAAISSFAFDLPHAVVDGNVYRVMTRYFGIEKSIDHTGTKKEMAVLAQQLLPEDQAADYNQAIMDFGATVCTPDKPLCLFCPLKNNCVAWNTGKVDILPLRSKKIAKKNRYLHYFLNSSSDQLIIRKRSSGIWKGLYELPMLERPSQGRLIDYNGKEIKFLKSIQHLLTHQKLHLYFYTFLSDITPEILDETISVSIDDWELYSFPKPILSFLKDYF